MRRRPPDPRQPTARVDLTEAARPRRPGGPSVQRAGRPRSATSSALQPITQREVSRRPEPQRPQLQHRLAAGLRRVLETVELAPGIAEPTQIEQGDKAEVAGLRHQASVGGGQRDGEDLVGDGEAFTGELRSPPVVEASSQGVDEPFGVAEAAGHRDRLVAGCDAVAVADVPVLAERRAGEQQAAETAVPRRHRRHGLAQQIQELVVGMPQDRAQFAAAPRQGDLGEQLPVARPSRHFRRLTEHGLGLVGSLGRPQRPASQQEQFPASGVSPPDSVRSRATARWSAASSNAPASVASVAASACHVRQRGSIHQRPGGRQVCGHCRPAR